MRKKAWMILLIVMVSLGMVAASIALAQSVRQGQPGNEVEPSEPSVAAIELLKTVGTDPNACATTTEITVTAGDDATYCYEVTNTGTVTLTLHDLEDSEIGPILTGFPYSLVPGASAFLTQTETIITTTVNTGIWTAYNAGPTDVVTATNAATVTVTLPEPGINLTKTVGTDPNVCASTAVINIPEAGDVTYCYEVTNTGTLTLTLHDVQDSNLGPIQTGLSFPLSPGESTFLTQTAAISTTTTNTATWTAYNAGPTDVVTDTDSATVTVGDVLPAEVAVSPGSLSETLGENDHSVQTVTISNTGGADLAWSIEEAPAACDTPGDIPWLSVSPVTGTTAGGSSTLINVTFDATGLVEGDYSGTLCVETNDPDEPTVPISIALTVVRNQIYLEIVLGSPHGNP